MSAPSPSGAPRILAEGPEPVPGGVPPRRSPSRLDASGPLVSALLAVVLLLAIPGTAVPQAPETGDRQVQVPLLPDRSIVEITPEIRRQLGLFPEIEDFRAARLFRLADGSRLLELELGSEGTLVREHRVLEETELRAFRDDLAERLAARPPSVVLDHEGRGRLVLSETLLGVAFRGWAVPVVLDLDDERAAVAAYLLTAGTSFFLPYSLTRNRPVSPAHQSLAAWGGTRGIVHGAAFARMLEGEGEEDFGRRVIGGALAGSVAGSALGYAAAGREGLDPGTAALWGLAGDAGILAGYGAAHVLGFLEEETVTREAVDPFTGERYTVTDTRIPRLRAAHGTALALSAGGLAAGRWLGNRESYTVGNVRALRSTGILGVQSALPLLELLVSDDAEHRDRAFTAGALAGGLGGLALGNRLLRTEAFSGSDGLLLNAGHLAGGLTALGLTYLAVSDEEDRDLLYLTTTALGSAGGFALTYRALSDRGAIWSRGPAEASAAPSGRSPARASGLTVSVDPGALLASTLAARARSLSSPPPVAPLLRIRF